MFEKLSTPHELFLYRLAEAAKMEQQVLKMLEELESTAHGPELGKLFHHHAEQTQQHVHRVEDAFTELVTDLDHKRSPAVRGLDLEGKSTLRKVDGAVVDLVALSSAAETEHHEIAVYEDLVVHAEAMGHERVAALLRRNLAEEEEMLDAVKALTERLAHETAGAGA